ncbi:hypothetical protein MZT86_27195, partial [Escherichia coli]
MRLASRFGYANQIRRDRPLTHEELMHHVPGIFGEDKHTSRSRNYTYSSGSGRCAYPPRKSRAHGASALH